ncbi:MAG: hypothetical protein IT450_08350 [Phycisphaerales bacterium]|nr:hypothetical protein [Phycisphaerales bacterium]
MAELAPEHEHVEALILKRCRLTVRELEPLGRALIHLGSLKRLDLGDNQLGSEGMDELGRYAARLRALQSLSLHHNDIGPVGLAVFMRTAEQLESLESFDLAGNPIGNEGALVLASSAEKLPALRKLGLFDCYIGDNGAEHLRQAARRPAWTRSLQEIGFRGNPVMDYEPLCRTNLADRWREFDPDSCESVGPLMPGPFGAAFVDLVTDEIPEAAYRALRAQSGSPHPSADVCADSARAALRRGLRGALGRSTADKRKTSEYLRSVLALLDACVAWPTDTISRRRLCASPLLRDKRLVQGLPAKVSLTTVGNHLTYLEEVSGGPIATPHEKRQWSLLVPGAKRRLSGIRHDVVQFIADLEGA